MEMQNYLIKMQASTFVFIEWMGDSTSSEPHVVNQAIIFQF
jgi:hypothetical protein